MKQGLIPKPKLTQKNSFNHDRNESLKILSFSHEELKRYLQEQMYQNPFLRVSYASEDGDAFLAYDHSTRSLSEEIMQQLQFCSQRYRLQLCEFLLSQLDSNGYFLLSYKELLSTCACSKEELAYHLALLHSFEPLGCFAFDLKDCLQIQCRASEEAPSETALILCDYLEALALHRYEEIMKKTQLTQEEIEEGFRFIQSCNPKPAANYATGVTYMMPEFHIEVQDGKIQIQRIAEEFSISLANEELGQEELNSYMRTQREQVKHIMNSVQKRNMTLFQIMNCICEVQSDYFLKHRPLHHLTLEMAAKHCGLHTSTISRALTNKAFEFENRYTPLKKMFVSGGVDDISQDEIKKHIIAIIEAEDKQHPFSDEAIAKELKKMGITLSRRGVAKYRDACFIFNSTKRKR